MTIFVYADESGVFDKKHRKLFVFAGLIFLNTQERENAMRRYKTAEQDIKKRLLITEKEEIKACKLENKDKASIYRSLNPCRKFIVVINQEKIYDSIYQQKKDKQRYLDYAFKRGIKNAFIQMINKGELSKNTNETLVIIMDEHNIASSGKYSLHESIEEEFKLGYFNRNFTKHIPGILPSLESVKFYMKDSKHDILIRACDLIANRAINLVASKPSQLYMEDINSDRTTYIINLP